MPRLGTVLTLPMVLDMNVLFVVSISALSECLVCIETCGEDH